MITTEFDYFQHIGCKIENITDKDDIIDISHIIIQLGELNYFRDVLILRCVDPLVGIITAACENAKE
jgi:hypothetical protein